MERLVINCLEAEIEGFKYLHLTALRGVEVVGVAQVYWLGIEGKAPELCNLFVAEAARRTGVAQALTVASQKAVGASMYLHVVRESPAYWLYRKLGFTEIGAVKEKENSVYMLIPAYA